MTESASYTTIMNGYLATCTFAGFSAEILAYSLNMQEDRVVTAILTLPRMILAELNTHRAFSRNSASSRAIPFKTMLEAVQNKPFIPTVFPLDHKGMQQTDESKWVSAESNPERYETMVDAWLASRDEAVKMAIMLHEYEMSKQLANRLLEPFMWHRVLLTANIKQGLDNFFALRDNPAAQKEIQIPAHLLLQAVNISRPKYLQAGEWHRPFEKDGELERLGADTSFYNKMTDQNLIPAGITADELCNRILVARCARVSYDDFSGAKSFEADLRLFARLERAGHWSPFEHILRAMTDEEYTNTYRRDANMNTAQCGWSGNIRGFVQLRKLYESEVECRTDSRIILNPPYNI